MALEAVDVFRQTRLWTAASHDDLHFSVVKRIIECIVIVDEDAARGIATAILVEVLLEVSLVGSALFSDIVILVLEIACESGAAEQSDSGE